jgi:hypothetical protein
MKKLVILGVLAGGWYVHSNDLIPDFGFLGGWSPAVVLARRADPAHGVELDRIQRMEADLDAQARYLDERAARVRELRGGAPGTVSVKAVKAPANVDEYNRELESLNDGVERFRRLYGTYRDDVERYNVQARRAGGAVHRPMAPPAEHHIERPVRRMVASVRG